MLDVMDLLVYVVPKSYTCSVIFADDGKFWMMDMPVQGGSGMVSKRRRNLRMLDGGGADK